MQIDRTEFMRLCAALALVGCHGGRDPGAAEAPVPAVAIEPGDGRTEPEPVELPAAPERCSNEGDTSACMRVSPACEGLPLECAQLAEDLRPPIAQAWAECFAEASPPKCRDRKLGACMRAGVENGCTLPGMLERCEQVMGECREAGIEPKYTLEQCGKIASAVTSDSSWADVNWERMGPSSAAEACSIEYVLPYQPFGWMWR